jgi:hypothetical protein
VKIVPLYLTYDNEIIQDGVGAQVMRIVAVRAISKYFKLGYLHSGIKKLTVTQLDPAQSQQEIDEYISYLNETFAFSSHKIKEMHEVYKVYNLSHRLLLSYGLRALILRRRILLKVTIPFYITDRNPKIFKSVVKLLPSFTPKQSQNKIKVVIHFRAGADPKHIDPGKSEARFVPIDYFEKLVAQIQRDNPSSALDLCLLTDAPAKSFYYSPPSDQLKKWEETGYEIKNGSVEIKALDLEESWISGTPGFRVVHGGDPIEAIKEMANADYLLMSRSTLSFLGALLNQTGEVIYPPRFGAKPIDGWVSGEKFMGAAM